MNFDKVKKNNILKILLNESTIIIVERKGLLLLYVK
mgnify:CR=1 FL=1